MSPPSGLPRRERRLTATNDALNLHHSFHVRRKAADVERMDRGADMLGGSGQSALPAGASPTEASRDDQTALSKYCATSRNLSCYQGKLAGACSTSGPVAARCLAAICSNHLKTQHLKAARPPLFARGGAWMSVLRFCTDRESTPPPFARGGRGGIPARDLSGTIPYTRASMQSRCSVINRSDFRFIDFRAQLRTHVRTKCVQLDGLAPDGSALLPLRGKAKTAPNSIGAGSISRLVG